MFSKKKKKYKLIHQGTGTVGSGGGRWTDLGKQSVFVFGAYPRGLVTVAVVKRGRLVQECGKQATMIRMSMCLVTK